MLFTRENVPHPSFLRDLWVCEGFFLRGGGVVFARPVLNARNGECARAPQRPGQQGVFSSSDWPKRPQGRVVIDVELPSNCGLFLKGGVVIAGPVLNARNG